MPSLPGGGARRPRRPILRTLLLLLPSLLLAACGSPALGHGPAVSPTDLDTSPLSSPTARPSDLYASPLPSIAATPTPGPFSLVVLHTNDTWGETEPCG